MKRRAMLFAAVAALAVAGLLMLRSPEQRRDRESPSLPPPHRTSAVSRPRIAGTALSSTPATIAAPHPTTAAPVPSAVIPRVVDLADVGRTPRAPEPQAEELLTNEWFTQDDLEHPERYFAAAERLPELNRPEERRDVLAFFLAYRERLQRELDAGADPGRRQHLRAVIDRYDAAIVRLRALLDAPVPR